MLEVYREIFFAGLPGATFHPVTGAPVFLPEALVRSLFDKYGELKTFSFDERRGVGRATFISGEDAEECYLGLQYAYLPLSWLLPGFVKTDRGQHSETNLPSFYLLYLEFAEYLPFVNPWLVKDDVGEQGATMSRQMLRTCPRRRRYSDTTGGDERQLEGFLDGIDVPAVLDGLGSATTPSAAIRKRFFTNTLPHSIEQGKPSSLRNDNPAAVRPQTRVTGMDLWHAYFAAFIDPRSAVTAADADNSATSAAGGGGGNSGAATPLYAQMVKAVEDGIVHLVDPVELSARAGPSPSADAIRVAMNEILTTVRSKAKDGSPLPRRVPFSKMIAAASAASRGDVDPEWAASGDSGRQQHHGSSVSAAKAAAAARALAQANAEDAGTAIQYIAAYLTFKVYAEDEPSRGVALTAFIPPGGPREAAQAIDPNTTAASTVDPSELPVLAVHRTWARDEVGKCVRTATRRDAGAGALFKAPGVWLPEAVISVMYRAADMTSAVGAVKLIDRVASSGSTDMLFDICRRVTAEEIAANAAEAQQKFRAARSAAALAWYLFRVPLMVLMALLALVLGLSWALDSSAGKSGRS
jgi:hypothetical protein